MTRSAVNQAVQIGKETVFGTAAAANQKLVNVGIELGVKAESKENLPAGYRVPTGVLLADEMSEGKADGTHSYTELHYFLSSMFGAPAITSGTAGTYNWTWRPASFGTDPSPVSFTVEQGDATGAMRSTGVFATGINYEMKAGEENKFGAELVGNPVTFSATMTGGPTSRPNVPVLPGETCVFVDTTFSSIGTTKLDAATGELFGLKYEHKGRRRSDRTINCDPAVPRAMVDLAADASLELVLAANTFGESLMEKFRTGQTFYVSIVSTSKTRIGVTASFYKLTHQLAVQIADPSFGEEKDKWAATYKLRPVHDATFNGSEKFELVTDLETF